MSHHVCPVWIGRLLASPLRRFAHDPERILGPHVREGMRVLDVGCAMGFFSLPLARMVGAGGRVVCIDMQEKMLAALERRARKAGVAERLEARRCDQQTLGLNNLAGAIDFALAFAVVHEVPDPGRLFGEIHAALKPGALLLVAEPVGHVRAQAFAQTVVAAQEAGFAVVARPRVRRSHAVLLRKPEAGPS